MTIIKAYIRKYGEPSACREHNPSRQDSNISLMYELGQGTVLMQVLGMSLVELLNYQSRKLVILTVLLLFDTVILKM